MFGYIVTSAENLSEERQARFRAFYCGLCRQLRQRYGIVGGATLSYDMTFLAVLLNALYEPEERCGTERCLVHPIRRHDYVDTPTLSYCADINIALTYHKCIDNWQDDHNAFSAAEARLLRRAYLQVCERWPGQCAAVENWLEEIHRIEKNGVDRIDAPVNATGRALGRLFAWREDVWAESLNIIGDGLGRFIYLMDAYEDLPQDLRRGRYNPLGSCRDRPDYEAFCRDALMMAVADATRAFELLPIERDADILRNIMYSGIWSKYMLIRKKRADDQKEQEHAGSL